MILGGTDIDRKSTSDFTDRQFSASVKEHFQDCLGDCIETCLRIIFFKFLDELMQSLYFSRCLIEMRVYCMADQ